MLRRLILLIALMSISCRSIHQRGVASWYGRSYSGKATASGEIFRPWKRTAAHKSLPLGTIVKVTNTDNGKSVRVVINDRGPYAKGRIIDLSRKAARKIDMLDSGVANVEIKIIGCSPQFPKCKRSR
jgi:rare lipoprotein A